MTNPKASPTHLLTYTGAGQEGTLRGVPNRTRVQVRFEAGTPVAVEVDGADSPIEAQLVMHALGADPPIWLPLWTSINRILEISPSTPMGRFCHYLSRPQSERILMLRAALSSEAAMVATPWWLHVSFMFDPSEHARGFWRYDLPARLNPITERLCLSLAATIDQDRFSPDATLLDRYAKQSPTLKTAMGPSTTRRPAFGHDA